MMSKRKPLDEITERHPGMVGELVDLDSYEDTPAEKPVPQPLPPTQPKIKAVAGQISPKNPVLNRLLSSFGLQKPKSYELKVKNSTGEEISFTLRSLTEELSVWAVQEAQAKLSEGQTTSVTFFQTVLAALCVVGIDDTPIAELFQIDNKIDTSTDKFAITTTARKATAKALTDLFWREMGPVADKIYEYYENKIAVDNAVHSSYDDERQKALESDDRVRYVCPLDECDVVEFLNPRFKNGEETPYYCKVHNIPLIKTANINP